MIIFDCLEGQELLKCLCSGIDVDIDVEDQGQSTKVTPPPQSGGGEGDLEMDGATDEGWATEDVEVSEGAKVSS